MRELIAAVLLGAIVVPANARAEGYPSRPVTLVVPFASGGGSDIVGRALARAMQTKLGQTVTVENAEGAGGLQGTLRVVKSASDGSTVLFAQSGITASTTSNIRQMDVISSSLDPIGLVAGEPYLIAGRKNLPAKDLNEFIQWLKARRPPALSSFAIGTHSHLANILFQEATHTQLKIALARGEKQSLAALAAGKTDVLLSSPVMSMTALRNGDVKAFAVTAKERVRIAADVPTTDEAGLTGFYFSRWYALWAPRGTAADIVARLNEAMVQALDDAELMRMFAAVGLQRFPREQLTPDALASYQKADFAKWLPVIRALTVRLRRA